MADEIVITPESIEKAETEVGSGFWGKSENSNQQQNNNVETLEQIASKAAELEAARIAAEQQEEILEPTEWLKREFEVDSPDILKAERAELKVARETLSKGYQYKDDTAKNIAELINEGKTDELYEYLGTQKKLDKLLKADLSDKGLAAELVKFGMQKDNPTLNQDDIDFLFNQKYSLPTKPVKGEFDKELDVEDDTDFDIRMDAWENKVSNIEKGLIIEAKMNQPKMAQLKTELVLPEIKKEIQQPANKPPTQEELEATQKVVNGFIESVETDLKALNELSITVQDEGVKIPISYTYSSEEKAKVSDQLKMFAEKNFDANAIFAERWINQDGSLNVSRMTRDLARLNSDEKIDQKLGNDAATKRLKEYTKEKKNIQLPGTSTQQNGKVDANKAVEEVEAAIWK